MYKQRVEKAINSIRNGEIVIIMDDEDRENEGDLVYAGIFSTAEKINFLAKEARGLICVSITKNIAQKLNLPPMVSLNSSNHETAFTISIDAKDAKTGISAFERDLTIKLMCNENTKEDAFVRPGHIFPLIAKEGGVLERTGHTEASLDLCKLAGIKQVAVICELMKEDGSMPGNGDKFISEFAKKHNFNILFVSDLVQYRLDNEKLVSLYNQNKDYFLNTECEKFIFKDHMNNFHTVFKIGDNPVPLIKFHRIKNDLELMQDYIHFSEFMNAINLIKKEGGYIIFLNINSCNDTSNLHKGFGIGAQILSVLKVQSFKLVTNNDATFVGISGFNLNLVKNVKVDRDLKI